MTIQDIKPGYKQSTLGLIPNKWDCLELKNVVDILDNKRKPFNSEERKGKKGDIPYYGANGIVDYINEYIFDDDLILIAEDGGNFSDYQTKPIAYRISGKARVNNHVHVLKAKSQFNQNYIFYSLEHKNILLQLNGGTRSKLNRKELEKIEIVIPSLPEQEAIANIFLKVDENIEKAQSMIEKLELRNKGLQQKLLKNDTWEYKPIEKIASEFSKRNKEDKNITVLSCTKYDGLVPSLEYFGKKIFSDNLITYKLIPKGYFAYATNHIEEGSIGYQDKYEEAIISPMYTVFKTNNEINDYFLFRVLKTHKYILEYKKRMEGSIDRRGGLRRNVFSKIMVPVPKIEEQNKIMDILNKATKQLELYKQKLEKLQELKKGLMQQLLTGKVRVKEFRN